MKRFIFALLLLSACTSNLEPGGDTPQAVPLQEEDNSVFIPGTVIAELDENLANRLVSGSSDEKARALEQTLDDLGIYKMERMFPDAGEWEPRHRKAGLHRWYRLFFDPDSRPATKASDEIISIPGVIYAEPVRRIRSCSYFNDPYAMRQWALYNDGSWGVGYEKGCDINVVPVWDNFTAGSPNVIVAVIDAGVQLDHPDLEANCIPGGENGSKCFIKGRVGYNIPPDEHGTHVAGIIAAVNNNEIGISGIAGGRDGKGVRIMSCAIMMDDPNDPDKVIQGDENQALVWAADHGAIICNNSWGYVYETEEDAKKSNAESSRPGIDYFIKYAGCDMEGNQRPDSPMKGGVVIFSAGNEGWTIGWPAAYEPVIAVAALGAEFNKTPYSSYGEYVDICAPGGETSKQTGILSTVINGEYKSFQGTSMAAPHVTGVAALIASYFGGPGFTNDMLKERLLSGANTTKVRQYLQIGPMLDALGSFTYGGTVAPVCPTGIYATSDANTITLSWKVTPDPDAVKTYGYMVLAAKDAGALKDIKPDNIPEDVKTVSVEVGTIPVGETITATLSDLEFEVSYNVAVIAFDYVGNYSELSDIQTISTGKNNAPVVTTDYSGNYRIKPYETITATYVVSDPDGHDFTVEIDPGSDAFRYKKSSGEYQVEIAGNGAPHGSYTAHIVATDSYGASTDYVIEYVILENHAPVVVSEMPNLLLNSTGTSMNIDMAQYVWDEDGEQLSYRISLTDQSIAIISPSGNSLTLTSLAYGLTTVTVTATDACNESCTLSFKLLVQDGSKHLYLYPNPVSKDLFIRPAADGTFDITISNKAGAVVFSKSSEISPFEPFVVDMTGNASGLYFVHVKGNGVDDIYTIAKI